MSNTNAVMSKTNAGNKLNSDNNKNKQKKAEVKELQSGKNVQKTEI